MAILEPVSRAFAPASAKEFVACQELARGLGRMEIGYLGENFERWFLSGRGKIEGPINKRELRSYRTVPMYSADHSIIAELGGEEKSETLLREMVFLVKRWRGNWGQKHKNTKSDILLCDGYVNIFFIRDQCGVLRDVGVFWLGNALHISAAPIEKRVKWPHGHLVFAHYSDPASASFESSVPA